MKLPIVGSFSTASSINIDSQRTINWYLETTSVGRNKMSLYPTPGSIKQTSVGTGPIRASIIFNDLLYVVSGSELYEINTLNNGVLIGSLSVLGSSASMAASSTELFIVDGVYGYILNSDGNLIRVDNIHSSTTTATTASKLVDTGSSFSSVGVVVGSRIFNDTDSTSAYVTAIDSDTILSLDTDIFTSGESYTIGAAAFPKGADQVVFVEGYFIVNDPDKTQGLQIDGSFFWSNVRVGTSWTATDFATAERDSDALVTIEKNAREVWMFGENSTEIWSLSGGAPIFTPVNSGYSEWGCAAKKSVQRVNDVIIWLSKNHLGQGLIVAAKGFDPEVVSTTALNSAIAGYTTVSDATSLSLQWKGHSWYVITFPSEEVTWVYDLSENTWFEWSSWGLGRLRFSTHSPFNNKHYMGDYHDGKIYTLDDDTYTENDVIIERLRRTQHMYAEDSAYVFHTMFEVEFEYGTGGSSDAQVMLRWSDDYGHTWSKEYWKPIGKTGEYHRRLRWKRLGSARDRVYEIRMTDAAKPVMVGGHVLATPSSREL